MKTVRFSVSLLATLVLSGCGSMMYGSGTAPVINQNEYANQSQVAPQYPHASEVLPPAPKTQTSAQQSALPTKPTAQNQKTNSAPQPPSVNDTPKYQAPNPPKVVAQTQATPPSASDTPKYETNPQSALPANTASSQVPVPPRISDTPKYQTQTTQTTNSQPPSATDSPKYGNDGWNVTPNNSSNVTRSETANVPPPVKVSKTETASDSPKVETTRSEPKVSDSPKVEAEKAVEKTVEKVASKAEAATEKTGSGAAVSDLLAKASSALGKGDLNAAASHLEAAQRLDSKNPKILYDIANIRYHQQRYREAETYAGRAANLGGENSMSKKSWQLISNARKALGDNQGAVQAAERAARIN